MPRYMNAKPPPPGGGQSPRHMNGKPPRPEGAKPPIHECEATHARRGQGPRYMNVKPHPPGGGKKKTRYMNVKPPPPGGDKASFEASCWPGGSLVQASQALYVLAVGLIMVSSDRTVSMRSLCMPWASCRFFGSGLHRHQVCLCIGAISM